MSYVSDAAISRLRAVAAWPEFVTSRYQVEREIGRGGMGTVYQGHDAELGRDVAIKVTRGVVPGDALHAHMGQEARFVAALEHPGIVPIHDVGLLADGRLFIVMKLVRGVTLGAHLATVRGLAERLLLFERVCEPVAFAHSRGIVHRDLKLSNVMIGAFGEVLVMDWGVAKRQGDGGDEGVVLGTVGYMAPEQAMGRAGIDARADVHALGGILFAMLMDREPGADESPSSALESRKPGLPKRLKAICLKAMAAEPAARYGDAAALGDDLARLRGGLPVAAYPETALDRAGRLAVKYRTPILLIATYLVVRTVIAVVFGR